MKITSLLHIILKAFALVFVVDGALVASQAAKFSSADIILMSLALALTADVIKSLGEAFGNNSQEKPTLPGPG